jgi:histone H1/5
MSIEKPLRELVQAELRTRLGPMHKAVARMGERLDVLEELGDIIQRLAPLATRMNSLQLALPGVVVPVPAGRAAARGRQAEAAVVPAPRGRPAATRAEEASGRKCAVIGCKRPARSKGYCSAHYQKLRLLVKTNRRPKNWVDDAGPQSVAEVVLPRGRAASKERQEAAPRRPEPAVPPKAKAWVRKKGGKERVELR